MLPGARPHSANQTRWQLDRESHCGLRDLDRASCGSVHVPAGLPDRYSEPGRQRCRRFRRRGTGGSQLRRGVDPYRVLAVADPTHTNHAINIQPDMSYRSGPTPRRPTSILRQSVTQRHVNAEVARCVGRVLRVPTAAASRVPLMVAGVVEQMTRYVGIHPAQISRSGRPRPPDRPGVPVAHQVMIRRSTTQGPSRGWDNARWSPLTRAGTGPVPSPASVLGRFANGVGISDVRPAALAVPLRFRVSRQTHGLPGMDVRFGQGRCGGHGGGLPLLVVEVARGEGCSWWRLLVVGAFAVCAPLSTAGLLGSSDRSVGAVAAGWAATPLWSGHEVS